jgi:hypothetical protein
MDGITLLQDAQAAGLEVQADGDRLVIRGPKTADPIARRLLRFKALVLAAIVAERCDHSMYHTDPSGNLLGTWTAEAVGGRTRIGCKVCGKLYGYLRAGAIGSNGRRS